MSTSRGDAPPFEIIDRADACLCVLDDVREEDPSERALADASAAQALLGRRTWMLGRCAGDFAGAPVAHLTVPRSAALRAGMGAEGKSGRRRAGRAGDSPVAGVQTTGQGLRMAGNTLLFLALPSRRSLVISRSRPARVNIGVRACPAIGRFSMHGCTSGLLRWWKTPQRYTRSPDDTASLQASHCTSPIG